MNAFIDTSALFKKYSDEPGRDKFLSLLDEIDVIYVSPVTPVELHSIVFRKVHEKQILRKDALYIAKEFERDYIYFGKVNYNENLEWNAIRCIAEHNVRSLDAIQLASGILAETDLFVTSDKFLYKKATEIFTNVEFI